MAKNRGKNRRDRDDDTDQDQDPKYWLDSSRKVYVFPTLRVTLPQDQIDRICEAYSWVNGKGATVNDIAREHALTRATVKGILRCLGKTHDSLGLTDEKLSASDEDELVEDQVRAKEQRVLVKAEKERWDSIKKVAEEAERWDQLVFRRLQNCTFPAIPKPQKPVKEKDSDLMLVAGLQDLHFGAYAWAKEAGKDAAMNRKLCRERLLDTTSTMLSRTKRVGKMDSIAVGVGGDFFHVDNPDNKTTHGTPQDCDGTFIQMLSEGFSLFAEYVNLLSTAANTVELLLQGGNHDKTMSPVLLLWAQQCFKDREDVNVRLDFQARQYLRFGESIMCFTHGDGAKAEKLPLLMANEAKEHWGQTKFRYVFSGHFHTQMHNEIQGVQIHHHSSLSGGSRWANQSGYVGNRIGMDGYIIDKEQGMIAHLPVGAKV